MKKITAILLCICTMFAMAGCKTGSDKNQNSTEPESTTGSGEEFNLDNYEFYEIDDYSKYVKLGQYEGVTVKVTPTDEDVDNKIKEILKTYTQSQEITDGTVEDGDTVNIDYTGYVDGETFEGGSGKSVDLVIGSNSFIDGFESGLIGAAAGDEVKLGLTFPINFRNKDLAGKAATFDVKINKITREVAPELTDEFANKYNSEYQTVDDMKAAVRAEIEADNRSEDTLTNLAWNVVVSNAEITDIPEEMIKYYYDNLYASYSYYVYYNYKYSSIEEYVAACDDLTMDDLKEKFAQQAQGYAGSELVYRAICADKGYEITDDAYNEFKENYKDENGSEPTDIEIRQGLMWQFAKDCVLSSVICE